ncbi:MAG: TRAM domain-containing protein [Bifidobacteriaceae bacterium]|nr:TRAM domain-containing protein [Bifidobacteriaceae bacterium]
MKLASIAGGGSSVGKLTDGKTVFVWGGIPGETAEIEIFKNNSNFAEGVVKKIIVKSPYRIEPKDKGYLSTSPYQVIDFEKENQLKKNLIEQAFALHNLSLPQTDIEKLEIFTDKKDYFYRNKYNYTFVYDSKKSQYSFAVTQRGSHKKIPVDSISLPSKSIDKYAKEVLKIINSQNIKNISNLLIRSSKDGEIVARLYIKSNRENLQGFRDWENLEIAELDNFTGKKGNTLKVTKSLKLKDNLLGREFSYCLDSFWQVNLPVYEITLQRIKQFIDQNDEILDFYSGVGSIGLSIINAASTGENKQNLKLIDIAKNNYKYAEENAKNIYPSAAAKLSSAGQSINYITKNSLLILDPPRAGLSKELVKQINLKKPLRIIYLSCNPATQARDIKNISENYKIIANYGYNYFCRTPHIEHLAILDRFTNS